MMQVAFRADASYEIGTGHVMRCLTLADKLSQYGVQSHFICRAHEGNLIDLVNKRGYKVSILPKLNPGRDLIVSDLVHGHWLGADWLTDAQQSRSAMVGEFIDWIIVDHYALDYRWESYLRKNCKSMMIIDDLEDRIHTCEVLLDQNQITELHRRYKGRTSIGATHLLGPKYALLHPNYSNLHLKAKPRKSPVKNIFVYYGGVDHHNLTEMTIAAFLKIKSIDLTMDVIVSKTNTHIKSILKSVNQCTKIKIHHSLPTLAEIILKADLAVAAGGSNTWERCCLGLPSLTISVAQNQIKMCNELHKQGLIKHLGFFENISVDSIAEAIKKELNSQALEGWSIHCLDQLDGRGAERVAEVLVKGADYVSTKK